MLSAPFLSDWEVVFFWLFFIYLCIEEKTNLLHVYGARDLWSHLNFNRRLYSDFIDKTQISPIDWLSDRNLRISGYCSRYSVCL